jgi:hypothetical protein
MKVDQSSTATIETLLSGKPPVKLADAKKTSPLIKVCLAGFIAVGGIWVVMTYLDNSRQADLAEQAQMLADQARSVVGQKPEEPPPPPMPWENMAQGVKFLEKCVIDVRKFRLSVPGWNVKEFFCDLSANGAAAALDRSSNIGSGGGSINWIKKYVERDDFHPSITPPPEGSGNRVRVGWSLDNVPMIPVDLKTQKIGRIREALLTVFEDRMTPIHFSEADSNQYWRGVAFEYETKIDPLAYADILSAIPGLMVDNVHYTVTTNTWSVKGRAYEQLPLPKKNP